MVSGIKSTIMNSPWTTSGSKPEENYTSDSFLRKRVALRTEITLSVLHSEVESFDCKFFRVRSCEESLEREKNNEK